MALQTKPQTREAISRAVDFPTFHNSKPFISMLWRTWSSLCQTSKAQNNEENVFIKRIWEWLWRTRPRQGSLAGVGYLGYAFFPTSRTKTKQNKCFGITAGSLGNTTIIRCLEEFQWKITQSPLENLQRTPLFM